MYIILCIFQFTFSDWLNYEISVDTDQDVFSYLER